MEDKYARLKNFKIEKTLGENTYRCTARFTQGGSDFEILLDNTVGQKVLDVITESIIECAKKAVDQIKLQ